MGNLAYAEDYDDDYKYEVINGVEYAMAPPMVSHNKVIMNLSRIIASYLRGKRCQVFTDTGVLLGENEVIPDLLVVCDPSKIGEMYIEGAPDFVVEVLSHSTEKRDRTDKFQLYEKYGVKEYWIVDTWGKSVDVYKLQNEKFALTNIHRLPMEKTLRKEEQAKLQLTIKLSLYDDLEFDVSEVFEGL